MSRSKTTRRKYPHFSVQEIKHKHPRQIIETTEIQGKESTLVIRRSMQSETTTTIIPEKANPDLIYVIRQPIKLCYYKGTQRVFVYKFDGNYCGCIEKHDLKQLFFRIGQTLKAFKKGYG
jgi:hypothetical protein